MRPLECALLDDSDFLEAVSLHYPPHRYSGQEDQIAERLKGIANRLRAAQPPQVSAGTKVNPAMARSELPGERALFEGGFSKIPLSVFDSAGFSFQRREDGIYKKLWTELLWRGWEARAAQVSAAAGVPQKMYSVEFENEHGGWETAYSPNPPAHMDGKRNLREWVMFAAAPAAPSPGDQQ